MSHRRIARLKRLERGFIGPVLKADNDHGCPFRLLGHVAHVDEAVERARDLGVSFVLFLDADGGVEYRPVPDAAPNRGAVFAVTAPEVTTEHLRRLIAVLEEGPPEVAA